MRSGRRHDHAPYEAIRATLLDALGPDLADRKVGGRSVVDALVTAVASGELLWTEAGQLTLPEAKAANVSPWIFVRGTANPRRHYPSCRFLLTLLHRILYRESAVPLGCRDCYKVKVEPRSLAELVAIRDISPRLPCRSKCGSSLNHLVSQGAWAAFYYVDGLEMAFAVHDLVAAEMRDHPRLRELPKISIKRGCTEFEMRLGPSNEWSFDETLIPLERALRPLFVSPERDADKQATFLSWIATAYAIGDDSYLELTSGKRLYPPTVDYLERKP